MYIFLTGIIDWFKNLKAALIGFGALGIFLIALMDAAFIPMPGGPDVVVISLSIYKPALMPLYVLAAMAGSTIGSLFLYFIALKGGQAALRKFSPEKRAKVQKALDEYDIWAMLVAAVMPPPFPFKLFVLSAGAFRMKLWRFVLAMVLGRGFRFVLEGVLAVRYGEQATEILKQHSVKIGLGVAATIVIAFLVKLLLNRRQEEGDLEVRNESAS
ncbi:MAG TPA: VTT domain-containing protein [Blastocatellia bacterium]|nr:VTT domain-containing protein [Blastocatellia bacterium]